MVVRETIGGDLKEKKTQSYITLKCTPRSIYNRFLYLEILRWFLISSIAVVYYAMLLYRRCEAVVH